MSDNNQRQAKSGSTVSGGLWVLALSAIVGFSAVYVTLGRPDNATVTGEKPSPAQTAEPAHQSSPTSTGAMAAFVTRKTPEAVPDIAFITGSGEPTTLSHFKGKTILLNLWATWCAPCREEMPSLDRLQQALGSDKFEVVAVSLDRQGVDGARKFLADVKAENLKLYADPTAKQGTLLKLVGMPTTLLIDKEGRELGRLAGPAEWDSADAKKLIEAALN